MIPEVFEEAADREKKKLAAIKNLAVRLLDDEDGIHEYAYVALLEVLPEQEALELNKRTKCQDGRFYLPEGHGLQDWRVPNGYEE